MRPEGVWTLIRVGAGVPFMTDTLDAMTQAFLGADAEACASFSFTAHSSQHTSTVLPPILTLKGFASSLQSQAAQVVSTMSRSSPEIRVRVVSHAGKEGAVRIFSDF